MVAIIGADTTAGSIRSFLSTSGRIDETNADHSTMAATVSVDRQRDLRTDAERPGPDHRGNGHRERDQQARRHLLGDDRWQVSQPDLTGTHRADEGGGDLGAGVTAGADQQRDEEREGDDCLHLVLEGAQHSARVCLGDEQHEEPDDPLAPQQPWRRAQVRHFQWCGPTLLFGVLGVLILDDVQCLVLGEDAEEPVVTVDDREFLQAPVHAQPCGLLGLGERLDRDDVAVDQVGNGAIGLCNHQAAERHRTEQAAGRNQ